MSPNSLMPEDNYSGTLNVNLVVHDGENSSEVYVAVVAVTSVNDAPEIDPIPDQEITEGSTFTAINLDDFVEDVETSDELITWSYKENTHLQVSIVDRVVTVTAPTADWTGSDTIVFIAIDDDATSPLSDSDTVVFTVKAINDPPVITGQKAISGLEDMEMTIPLSSLDVSDEDNEESDLTVEILSGEHYSVASANTLLPEENYNGALSVNLCVNDLECSSEIFVAEVTVTSVNDTPEIYPIPDQVIPDNLLFKDIKLDDFVEDVETPDESITWTYAENNHLQVSIVDRVATITVAEEDWSGIDTIVFMATDDDATNPITVSDTVLFTVISTTGIEHYKVIELVAYPNPTEGLLKIKLSEVLNGEIMLQVFTVQGELVKISKQSMLNNHLELNIQDQLPGNYFIRVVGPDVVATIEITKL